MSRKSFFLCGIMACATMLMSCNSSSKDTNKEAPEKTLVGGDRDDHGCIASAGYQWSELLKDCIRPWEKGVKLGTPIDTTSTSAAYLVFNADSSLVEVYLPQTDKRPILKRENTTPNSCWSDVANSDITVKTENGTWAVYQNDEPIFLQ